MNKATGLLLVSDLALLAIDQSTYVFSRTAYTVLVKLGLLTEGYYYSTTRTS